MQTETSSVAGRHGTTIVYDVHRPAGDPVGVVVISHGMGEHGGRYRHLARALTDLDYLVVVPDHVGHGRSGGKRMRVDDFGDFIADLDTVIDAVGPVAGPRFLIGHSMGGAIALRYALDHPDQLHGLVLSGAALVPGKDLPPVLVKLAPFLGRVVPWLPSTALPPEAVSRDPDVVADYQVDPLVWHGKVGAGLGGQVISAMAEFPKELPSLIMPTLVLHGSADVLANPDGSVMVGELAGADDVTVTIYPGLFHEIFNEPERDAVIGEVTDWLVAHTA